jgi:hypothetical protein
MREDLKALGLADEVVNAVMVLHGKKMTEAIKQATAGNEESKAAQEELKKYQKGGEYYVDKKEHERLKAFETETLTKAEREKKAAALTKLYKSANASESAIKLLIKGHNLDEVTLDDKGEVKDGSELLKSAKADYADLFAAGGNAGAPHAHEEQGGNGSGGKSKQVVY